jgi:hypothetical protein
MKEISYFAYKRINHFQEWISQIQGKETTDGTVCKMQIEKICIVKFSRLIY